MKKINIISGAILLAGFVGFFSCKRDVVLKDPAPNPSSDMAFISLIDASPNLNTVLNAKADTFNVLFNGVKVTGYTTGTAAAMTFGSIYPFSGTGSGYAAVASGDQQVKFVKGVNTLDSLVLATFQFKLTAGKYYSFIVTDAVNSGQDTSRMFIQDVLPAAATGSYNLRFVNTCLNDTGNVDIYSRRQAANIFSNMKPGAVTAFTTFPTPYPLTDTLYVRRAGTNIGLDTLNTQNLYQLRSYTLLYKGNPLSNNTKGDPKRRHIIVYVNK